MVEVAEVVVELALLLCRPLIDAVNRILCGRQHGHCEVRVVNARPTPTTTHSANGTFDFVDRWLPREAGAELTAARRAVTARGL
jgi:hypothetical protein